MKKITLLFLGLVGFSALAQTTYPSTSFASQGNTFTVTTAAGFLALDFTQTGASQTWNFSALTTQSVGEQSWIDPNATGYKTSWCFSHFYVFNCNSQFNSNFNLAGDPTEGISLAEFGVTNVKNHLHKNALHLESRMIGATIDLNGTSLPITVDYTQPDVVYQFPITFNTNYTNTSALNVDFSTFGVDASIVGTTQRTNEVNGWGSLVTPAGSYASVLKMKTTLVTDQTVTYEGQATPTQTTAVIYSWFDPAVGIPVLTATGTEVGGQFVPARVTYFGQSLRVSENSLQDVSLYPNPTTGVLNLSRDLSVDAIFVYDILGAKVGNSLDLSDLSFGIYFVRVTTKDGSLTRKIVKK
ncbi:T9SS type A sorting domain-containing protein [Flavobacterium sp.]|uniref:T9SS type A sorting domain-containing protein n=1 Tax=Flavobacterium sp. TaxID=239 RepID=UPI001226ABBA|nr:T9SS type A sorting domain-containing protein [Flavobacterium sp.]RZJ69796.1 MAG: T9SS type A sorting domain-containing protein [Flavobacterium sp.]